MKHVTPQGPGTSGNWRKNNDKARSAGSFGMSHRLYMKIFSPISNISMDICLTSENRMITVKRPVQGFGVLQRVHGVDMGHRVSYNILLASL